MQPDELLQQGAGGKAQHVLAAFPGRGRRR
jgi:hypothetical protein